MVLILSENYDYVQEFKMQTWNASLTMYTAGSNCVYFYICMLLRECGCIYVSMWELVSICILFCSSVLAVWWSLKHGNPGIISYPIPLWLTNGNPGGLLLQFAQERNYGTHAHTETHIHTCSFYIFTKTLNWHEFPSCSHYTHSKTHKFTYTCQQTQRPCILKHTHCLPYTPVST